MWVSLWKVSKEMELVVMKDHEESEKAQKVIEEALWYGVLDEVLNITVLKDESELDKTSKDLGIQKVPALRVKGQWYQGLGEIQAFLNSFKVYRRIKESSANACAVVIKHLTKTFLEIYHSWKSAQADVEAYRKILQLYRNFLEENNDVLSEDLKVEIEAEMAEMGAALSAAEMAVKEYRKTLRDLERGIKIVFGCDWEVV